MYGLVTSKALNLLWVEMASVGLQNLNASFSLKKRENSLEIA